MAAWQRTTIGDLFHATAAKHPDHEALIVPETGLRLTYRELEAVCRDVAKGAMAMGLGKGDHVAVWSTNLPEWVYLQFGLAMAGAVLVTVNTNYKSHEIEYILNQSDSRALFLMGGYRDTDYHATMAEVIPGLGEMTPGSLCSPSLPKLTSIVAMGSKAPSAGMTAFEDFVAGGKGITDAELDARMASLDSDDVINMQYTSGTTGFPKGVMLSHDNIVNNARLVGDIMGMTHEDRLLIHVPLFHCFGCVMSTLNSAYYGSTMVVMESFNPVASLKAINDEKCTAINGVPTMFIAMLNHPDFDQYDMSSMRTGIMAGAPCPVEVMRQVNDKMHCPEVVIAFGQTESSPVMTMTKRDDPLELRVSTVGRLLDDIEGAIVDPETGEEVARGVQGEIVTRSGCVMKGYYKMEEATAKAIDKDGWLHTGDLGTMDEAGYFRVTGRIKDMIIRGGENIYPREIEEFLFTNEHVEDVQVVGIPDAKYGEQVLAVVQLKEGATMTDEAMREFCTGKIARHKIPRYFEFVTEYPMTASGKIQKYKLRDLFAAKYGS